MLPWPRQPAAMFALAQFDFPKSAAVGRSNSVMLGQALIQECVVGAQQLQHVAIVTHDAFEEQFRPPPECLAEIVVEAREQPHVGDWRRPDSADRATDRKNSTPSASRPLIGEHAAHLVLQHSRRAQFSLNRDIQQFVVGNAAPQKERKSRSEFEIANPVRRSVRGVLRILFRCEIKFGDSPTLRANPFRFRYRTTQPVRASLKKFHRRLNVGVGDWPAIRAFRQASVKMRLAQASSSRAEVDWHTSNRRRLGRVARTRRIIRTLD